MSWRFSDEYLEQIEKQIEEFPSNPLEELLEEQEYPFSWSLRAFSDEEISKEVDLEFKRNIIKYCQNDRFVFIECLLGRKLTNVERHLFTHANSIDSISYRPYRPDLFYQGKYHLPFPNVLYLRQHKSSHLCCFIKSVESTITDCSCNLMYFDDINSNQRIYHQDIIPASIEDFIEEIKESGQWFIISPIKNESEDLQPYKNIIYPWDDRFDDIEVHHRIEIGKPIGDSNYDFHSKSGRYNRKRSKVV